MKPTTISRRHFTKMVLAGATCIAGLNRTVLGTNATATDWRTEFHHGLARHPWLKTVQGLTNDSLPEVQAQVSGTWPTGLSGTLYRNGPAQFELGGGRQQHWFDGDGLIQAWRIRDGRVSHAARFVQTRRYAIERKKGEYLFGGFGTPTLGPVMGPDDLNQSNTSVIHHADELWSLWEAGSPYRVDPKNLQTKGIISFSNEMAGAPFSAHPRLDADGVLWNFGYVSHPGMIVLWRIEQDGKLGNSSMLPVTPISIPHDFVVTQRHVVILFPPLHYEHERRMNSTFLDSHVWKPDLPTRVMVIDKNDMQSHFWVDLPAQWVFHFSNAWEDNAGLIRFEGASAEDPSLIFGFLRNVMRGEVRNSSEALSHATQYVIDTQKRTAHQSKLLGTEIAVEFPTIDPRRRGLRNQWVNFLTVESPMTRQSEHGFFNALLRLNVETGKYSTFAYPANEIAEEHLFVPNALNESKPSGWLLGSTIDWKHDQTHLYVFDAASIQNGPVAKATINRLMPLGLHGTYVNNV